MSEQYDIASVVERFRSSGAYSARSGEFGLFRVEPSLLERAEENALSGVALSKAEFSMLALNRAILAAAVSGGHQLRGGETETAADDFEVLSLDVPVAADRKAVLAVLGSLWPALASVLRPGPAPEVRAAEVAFAWFPLAAIGVVVVGGVAAYVFRDVVPALVEKWSREAANDQRIKGMLKNDATLAAAVNAHLDAERRAGAPQVMSPALVRLAEQVREDNARLLAGMSAPYTAPTTRGLDWVLAAAAVAGIAVNVIHLRRFHKWLS